MSTVSFWLTVARIQYIVESQEFKNIRDILDSFSSVTEKHLYIPSNHCTGTKPSKMSHKFRKKKVVVPPDEPLILAPHMVSPLYYPIIGCYFFKHLCEPVLSEVLLHHYHGSQSHMRSSTFDSLASLHHHQCLISNIYLHLQSMKMLHIDRLF